MGLSDRIRRLESVRAAARPVPPIPVLTGNPTVAEVEACRHQFELQHGVPPSEVIVIERRSARRKPT